MALSGPARQHLDAALRIVYPDYADLRRDLLQTMDRRLQDIVSDQRDMQDVRAGLLTTADAEGWLDDVLEMLAKSPNISIQGLLVLAYRELAPITVPGADIFQIHRVSERPFLDRERLRESLADLMTKDYRVLCVTGRRPCGKSHSWRLADLAAREYGFEPVLVDVDTLPATERTPLGIVSHIALQLGLPGAPPADSYATAASQAQRLFDWLVGQARRVGGERWLIVVDSMDKLRPPLSPEALELLILLGREGAVNNRIAGLRVVLLGHRKRFPPNSASLVLSDTFDDIDDKAVGKYFETLVRIGEVEADAKAIKEAVAVVESALVGCTRAQRLERLPEEVDRVAKVMAERSN